MALSPEAILDIKFRCILADTVTLNFREGLVADDILTKMVDPDKYSPVGSDNVYYVTGLEYAYGNEFSSIVVKTETRTECYDPKRVRAVVYNPDREKTFIFWSDRNNSCKKKVIHDTGITDEVTGTHATP